ncbi:MAG TPA: hypothetical protein VFU06_04865 [Longimicrobiales bacterium]|nr:hypothetical protein [Longimicrobiales bacterium]
MDTAAVRDAAAFRRVLVLLVAVGMAGLSAELALLEHYEEWQQLLPLGALGAGSATLVGMLIRPGRASVRLFQVVMAVFVVLGGVGIALHVSGNIEFELEMEPGLRGATLLWKALTGATPALAPGALTQTGLLGLLATWRHPALQRA